MLRLFPAWRVLLAAVLLLPALPAQAQAPVEYRLSFPEPEHRWMQVDITFADVPPGPLEVRMSRTSPGRYALHEFARNVLDFEATDAAGAPLMVTRPDGHQWDVSGHAGTVHVRYRIFGDRVDGTYLGIDSTHAHLNIPASLAWARGLDARPVVVEFVPPPGGDDWQVITQLFPGPGPRTWTAPNLQYLMDSPTEFSGDVEVRTFSVADGDAAPAFRVAVHHTGTAAEVDAFARDVEAVVRETRGVFGEFPAFDTGAYTFIADYLPWASGDGMEHRNSTILTSGSSLAANRAGLLGTVAHEFVHAWNVERVRPATLEPFDFEQANYTAELWLAEGVTSYYGPLMLRRAGLMTTEDLAAEFARVINTVVVSPGRTLRTVEEMSLFAPFVDAATSIDRTAFDNTFISYYTWGEAIGLGLDLMLRSRPQGAATLDDVMRALWDRHGRPGGAPGYVDRPYAAADVEAVLAEVSGDAAFARDVFARYIQGHEAMDYAALLDYAGLAVVPRRPGVGYVGTLSLRGVDEGVLVAAAVPFGTPVYAAGLERDDVIVSIGGRAVRAVGDVVDAVSSGAPGDRLPVEFERRGTRVAAEIVLGTDPYVDVIPAELVNRPVTAAQRAFRDAWLASRAAN
jgi:predicted metalloprotease with PDZ domain